MKRQSERDPNYRLIGRVLRPHGVRGELRVEVFAEEMALFDQEVLYLGPRLNRLQEYAVEGLRAHQGKVLLTLADVDGREAADAFRGWEVYVAREDVPPLEEGEFFLYELIGMTVVTEEGETLGTVTDTLRTGANDVFVVSTAESEVLIPDVPDVVLAVKRAEREIVVRLLEGLL